MAISSAASTANSISQIQQQVKALQKDVTAENQSTDDAKTKAVKLEMYQLEISEDEAEIQSLNRQSQAQAQAQSQPAPSTHSTVGQASATTNKIDVKA